MERSFISYIKQKIKSEYSVLKMKRKVYDSTKSSKMSKTGKKAYITSDSILKAYFML